MTLSKHCSIPFVVLCICFGGCSSPTAPSSSPSASGSFSGSTPLRLRLELREHKGPITSMAMHPEGERIAVGDATALIKVLELRTDNEKDLRGHDAWVSSVAFSPDGKLLASGGFDKLGKIWDVKTEQLTQLRGHKDQINGVAFDSKGKRVATVSNDRTIRLWDVATGKQLHVLEAHKNYVVSVQFSPTEDLLATGSGFTDKATNKLIGELLIWDLSTRKAILEVQAHPGPIHAIRFTPDGKQLLTTCLDPPQPVKLWDVKTGKEIPRFPDMEANVTSLTLTADGRRLITGASDGWIRFWSMETGRKLTEAKVHPSQVTSVVITPDSKLLIVSGVTLGQKGSLKFWDVAPLPAD